MLCSKMMLGAFITFGFYIVSSHFWNFNNGVMQPLMDIENKFAMFVMPTEREQAVLTRCLL